MQNKLRLNLDQLNVDSFQPQTEAELKGLRGTVNARASLAACTTLTLYDATCRGYGTCNIYPCKQIP